MLFELGLVSVACTLSGLGVYQCVNNCDEDKIENFIKQIDKYIAIMGDNISILVTKIDNNLQEILDKINEEQEIEEESMNEETVELMVKEYKNEEQEVDEIDMQKVQEEQIEIERTEINLEEDSMTFTKSSDEFVILDEEEGQDNLP